MHFADEQYVRLYTRDTTTWKLLGWQGRVVMLMMLRNGFDRSGVFEVGDVSRNVTPSHNLYRAVTAVTELPKEVVELGLEQVISEGVWIKTATGLVWPKYVEAQTTRRTDKSRKRLERDRRLASMKSGASDRPMSRNVTTSHNRSHGVTSCHSEAETEAEAEAETEAEAGTNNLSSSLSASPPNSPPSAEASGTGDPTESKSTAARDRRQADAIRVFEFWRQDTGHHRSKLDAKRRKRIEARLRDGFTADELIDAIKRRRNDPFLMGGGPDGRVFDGIETLLRDVAQVERLRDLDTMKAPAKRSNSESNAEYNQRLLLEALES